MNSFRPLQLGVSFLEHSVVPACSIELPPIGEKRKIKHDIYETSHNDGKRRWRTVATQLPYQNSDNLVPIVHTLSLYHYLSVPIISFKKEKKKPFSAGANRLQLNWSELVTSQSSGVVTKLRYYKLLFLFFLFLFIFCHLFEADDQKHGSCNFLTLLVNNGRE